MSSYLILKYLHITTAVISIAGFIIRGIWMIQKSNILQKRSVKIIPHINDSILLLSAILLVFITSHFPGSTMWLNAKILALVIYIILGTIALKRGKTMKIRIISGLFALIIYSYIVIVAITKNAIPII